MFYFYTSCLSMQSKFSLNHVGWMG
uniref:Uncharacterized protein n=1 Tax=Arundo donax TaxID=35708 RepID=A0A0A9AIA4_ARUDO